MKSILLNKAIALDSQAVIRYVSSHTRLGGGSALIGKWRWTGNDYQVVSGTLTAKPKAAQDLRIAGLARFRLKISSFSDFRLAPLKSASSLLIYPILEISLEEHVCPL